MIITNNQSLGNARLLLNGNNNGTAGDVRFENSVTLANDVVLFNTSNVDPFHTGGNTVTLTGTVSGIPGGFGLSKIGAGTLILSGPTTYAADTAINGGTLALAGDATLASSPNIILGSGAIFDISAIETTYALAFAQTLRGVGTVEGAFTANGTISPGAAVNTLGTLTFNDGLVMGTAVNLLQIDTSTGQSDRLIITGDVVANNATALTVTDIATVPAALPAGTKIALMQYTGTFTGLLDINAELDVADGASITIGANTFVVDYDDTTDGVNPGKYLTLTVPGAPPSPYTTWAAANGLDGTPGKESGKFVDPDNDGKVNFVEFFLGGTPLDGALGGLSAPVVTDRLILTFAAPAGTLFTNGVAVVDGVTCTVQGSSNLQNFTAPVTKLASPVLTGLDWPVVAPAGYEYFSFQLDDSVSLDEGGFMRLHFAE
jgi:autotransporter-associated beta strand protein